MGIISNVHNVYMPISYVFIFGWVLGKETQSVGSDGIIQDGGHLKKKGKKENERRKPILL